MPFLRFLAACFLTFRLDHRDVASALDALPSHHLHHQAPSGLSPAPSPLPSACRLHSLHERTSMQVRHAATL